MTKLFLNILRDITGSHPFVVMPGLLFTVRKMMILVKYLSVKERRNKKEVKVYLHDYYDNLDSYRGLGAKCSLAFAA